MPDGSRRWMHGRVAPDLDAGGRVRGLYCTEYDIHDLKLTEQALAAREEQLRLFTDNIPEPVVYLDDERRYTFVNEAFIELTGLSRERVIGTPSSHDGEDGPLTVDSYVQRALAGESVTYERPAVDAQGRSRWLRARIVPDFRFDGTIKGVYVVGHDITDLKQVAGRAGGARVAAARDHGRRAGAGRLHRPRRALPLRQPHLPAVLRPDRRAGRRAAAARRRRPRHLPERAGDAGAGARGRVDRLRPAGAGRRRGAALDDDPRRPRHRAVGRGARRVRADERHPRPQAGAGSAARVRGRAAAHHGQRAGARRLHRRRVSLPLRQPARRGMDGGEPQGGDRPAGRGDDRTAALRAARAAARARARRRDGRHRACCSRSTTASCAGSRSTTRPTATPRARSSASTRCTPTSTTRSATRKRCAAPTGCCRPTSTTRRSRCWSGTAISRLVRWSPAGREHLRLARRRGAGDAALRQPAAARVRPRGDGGDAGEARRRRGAARDRPDAQPPEGRRDDLVRVVPLVPARRRRAASCRSCRSCRT